jgi:hypothetical protein
MLAGRAQAKLPKLANVFQVEGFALCSIKLKAMIIMSATKQQIQNPSIMKQNTKSSVAIIPRRFSVVASGAVTVILMLCGVAHAQTNGQSLIDPVVASFSSQLSVFDRYATNTADGAGMTGPGYDTDTHGNVAGYTMWDSTGVYGSPPDQNPFICFDLGTNYNLAITRIWQYSEAGNTDFGASNIIIWTSPDLVTFAPSTNALNPAYPLPFQDAFTAISSNTLNEGLGNGYEPAQDITNNAPNVRYVEIQILNTWAGAFFWNGGVGPNGSPDDRFITGLSAVRFVVNGPAIQSPLLSQEPLSQTNATGATATFTVGALDNGVPPLSYQWQWNGQNLSDATNATLTIPNVTTTNAGSYDVIVSNSTGPTVSWTAILTVLPSVLTNVSISLNPGITFQGLLGYNYQVQYSTTLGSNAVWQVLQNVPQLPSSPYTVYDPTAVVSAQGFFVSPQQFYRIVFVP